MGRKAFIKHVDEQLTAPNAASERLVAALTPMDDQQEGRRRADRLLAFRERLISNAVAPGVASLTVIQHLGDRWSPLVLLVLTTGTYRHSELQRVISLLSETTKSTKISQHVLTMKLRALERDGFISRTVWATVPPRAEYALTRLGTALSGRLWDLIEWSERHDAEISTSRSRFDSRRTGDDR